MNLKSILNRFPVQAALVALLVYLATLSGGATVYSIALTAKLCGWDYQPLTGQPLFWLLTLPVRWLPAGWIPLALNVFSATCAAATLGLLAATLELAVWNRPLAVLRGWRARLPLALGLAVCGLEFNFWQAATQATGESLQVLLLAAAIWCLFNYRATREPRWLQRAAFVWGLGMVENWMMLATLPVFVVLVLWLMASLFLQRKVRVIQFRDLAGLALAGLAGFSIFALLPTVNGLWPGSPLSFGGAWWSALREFKGTVHNAYVSFMGRQPLALLVMLVFFLIPAISLLPALIRMPDKGPRTFSSWDRYQAWLTRMLRAVSLLFCLWLAFDPALGLRQIFWDKFSLAMPLLSFDYLVGLSAGFLGGNLLLAMVGKGSRRRRWKRDDPRVLPSLGAPAFAALLALVMLGLLLRNAAAITLPKRQPFSRFGELAMRSLPPGGGVVMGDDPVRLLSFQAAAARLPRREWLAVNTDLLPRPDYRRWLAGRFPGRWTAGTAPNLLTPEETIAALNALAKSNRVFYLHDCFGALLETSYLQPAGMVCELKKYPDQSIHPPAPPADLVQSNENFWSGLAPEIAALRKTCAGVKPGRPGLGQRICSRLYLKPAVPIQSHLLAQWYAAALDSWGVQLKRAGKAEAALTRFEQALELNEHNLAALVNLQCQTNLAAGMKMSLAGVPALAAQFDSIDHFYSFVLACGPVDEPAFCYLMGVTLRGSAMPRQAMQQLDRAAALAPGNPAPRLVLAGLYTTCDFHEKARQAIDSTRRALPPAVLKTKYVDVDLGLMDARLWFSKSNVASARACLDSLLNEYPGDRRVEDRILNAYLGFHDVTNALRLIEGQIVRTPADPEKLNLRAALLAGSGGRSEADGIRDHPLATTNLPGMWPDHALAQLSSKNYEMAEGEFRKLELTGTSPAMASYGLAAIAEHREDTNLVRHYLEVCRTNARAGSLLQRQVSKRLEALNADRHAPGR